MDDRIYCIYIAANEELLREHARQGGFPANRISEVRAIIDPTTAGSQLRYSDAKRRTHSNSFRKTESQLHYTSHEVLWECDASSHRFLTIVSPAGETKARLAR